VANDVLLRELRLKQVDNVEAHALQNSMIKRLIYFYIRRMLKSSYSTEAALTLDWDYNGFPQNLKRLYAKKIVSQITMLVNRIKEIAYRGTEKKTLTRNAIIKFKSGNPVRIYINFLSPVRGLYLNKTFFRRLIDVAAEGKIKTKVKLPFQFNLNSCAYRSGKNNLLAFELSKNYSITKRLFTTRLNSKSDYIDKSLTNDIKLQLNSKK
jgi:hypothetical protein